MYNTDMHIVYSENFILLNFLLSTKLSSANHGSSLKEDLPARCHIACNLIGSYHVNIYKYIDTF